MNPNSLRGFVPEGRDKVLRKLRSGPARTLGSYVAGFGTQGVYFLLLARSLEANDFGLWAGALALTTVFGGLVGLGAGNVLVVTVSRDKQVLSVQLGAALIYIIASALPFGLLAWLIGSSTNSAFAQVLLPLLLSELVAVRIFDVALQVFQARDDLTRNSLCRILGGAFRLFAVAVFFLIGTHTVVQWSYWYACTTIISAVVVMFWAIIRYGKPQVRVETLRSTWRTGVFFAVGVSSRTLYLEADKFLLNRFGMAEAAGSLSAANKLVTMAFAPVQALIYSSNTAFFRAGHNGARSLWLSIKTPLVWTLLYGVVAGILMVVASPLAPVVLGPSYSEVSHFLVWLSPLLFLNGIHYLFGDALMGLGRQGTRSISQFIVAALSVLANLIFIPIFGVAASVVIALCCSTVLAGLMSLFFVKIYRSSEVPRLNK